MRRKRKERKLFCRFSSISFNKWRCSGKRPPALRVAESEQKQNVLGGIFLGYSSNFIFASFIFDNFVAILRFYNKSFFIICFYLHLISFSKIQLIGFNLFFNFF